MAILAGCAGTFAALSGKQKQPQAVAERPEQTQSAPTTETVNSVAQTVMITIPSEGMAAAVLAEPIFDPNPANIAGTLADKQTAELTGKTQDGFSEIKWGDGTKWVSTCYTQPGGCQQDQPVGDLR